MKILNKPLAYVVLWAAIAAPGYGGPSPFGGGSVSPFTAGNDPFGGRPEAPVVRETVRVSLTSVATRPKLLELFEECRKNYVVMASGTTCTKEVASAAVRAAEEQNAATRPEPKLTYKLTPGMAHTQGLRVQQRLDSSHFLVSAAGDGFHLTTRDGLDLFDGDPLPVLHIRRSGTFEYVGTSGALRSVPAYEQVGPPVEVTQEKPAPEAPKIKVPTYSDLTQDTFVAALKKKQSFVVTRDEAEACKRCSGTGVVSQRTGGYDLTILRESCGGCGGSGKLPVRKEYTLVW
jgi:hypothetical protein